MQEATRMRERTGLAPGSYVDHYRITRRLAGGGMGEVYVARDTKLGRRVALKLLGHKLEGSERALKRLLLEARTTASLSHPHIVTLHAVGEHDGRPYLALEYLEGQNLAERMHERRPSLREALRFGLAIAEALAAAHGAGVLHRDLKPANVVIPRDGRLRVVDFGIAKRLREDEEPASSRLVDGLSEHQAADTAGTPAYMAPEQWRGEPSSEATDVWALGLILFEMCAGTSAFDIEEEPADSERTLEHPLGAQLQPLPPDPLAARRTRVCSATPLPRLELAAEVPAALADLVARCLAKASAERPTAAQVAEALLDLVAVGPSGRTPEDSPYRGLLPFGRRHAQLYFGRESDIAAFVERARAHGVLPVIGPSGVGKSSFVQAGVLPRLAEQQSWIALHVRPGGDPFRVLAQRLLREDSWTLASDEASLVPRREASAEAWPALAAALSASPASLAIELRRIAEERRARVLLFVDQLEELFTLVDDANVRDRYMAAICGAADDPLEPVRVVFTVRGDFLDRLATGPEARDALRNVTVLRPPDARALEEILVKPLALAGYRFEDGAMVREMIAEVGGEPACLPLLQFAAHQLWEARDRAQHLLPRAAYARMGGVAGALARHADGVLEALGSEELRIARELFLRLVTPERTRRVLSRAAALAELEPAAERVLGRLVESRLVTVSRTRGEAEGEATLELAHESLVQTWATLRRWLDSSAHELRFLSDAGQAAERWERRGRQPSELWSGEALREGRAALAACASEVPRLVRAFFEAATAHERRARRRRRVLVGAIMSVLGAAAIVLAVLKQRADGYALRAQEEAAAAGRARAHAEHSNAQALVEGARAAFADGRVIEARAKLRMAMQQGDGVAARALWRELCAQPLVWSQEVGGLPYGVAVSPDGATVAHANQDRLVYLFDVATASARLLRGSPDQIFSVAFSPSGELIAAGTWSGDIRVSRRDGSDERILRQPGGGVQSVAFSSDGGKLLSASRDGGVRLWDIASGKLESTLGHRHTTAQVARFTDDRHAVSIGNEGVVRIWDLASGENIRSIDPGAGGGDGLDARKNLVVGGFRDGVARAYQLDSGALLRELRGHRRRVYAVAIAPDGARVASGDDLGNIRLWSPRGAEAPRVLRAHGDEVRGLAFLDGGRRLASTGFDRTVKLWDLTVDGASRHIGHVGPVYGLSFSPDGARLASGGYDRSARVWDVASGRELASFAAGSTTSVGNLAFAPDGRWIAVPGGDEQIRFWDPASDEVPPALSIPSASIGITDYSATGLLLSGGGDGVLRAFDPASRALRWSGHAHAGAIRDIAHHPDGRRLATTGDDGTVQLWSEGHAEQLLKLPERGDGVSFAPDGRSLFVACVDGALREIDLATKSARELWRHATRIYAVSAHPDGRTVLATTADGSLAFVDRATQKARLVRAHRDEVNYARLSPDARTVATSSDDGTVRLWDATSGRPRWRAPLLWIDAAGEHARLYTHRGWETLAGGGDAEPPAVLVPLLDDARWGGLSADRAHACLHTLADELVVARADEGGDVLRRALPGLQQVTAARDGCFARTSEGVWLVRDGKLRELGLGAPTALGPGRTPDELAAVIGGELVWLDTDGRERGRLRLSSPGATAVVAAQGLVAIGFRDGNVEVVPTAGAADERAPLRFENVPASAPSAMIAGPHGTLAIGYANGVVGLWDGADGRQLAEARLHGTVVHLVIAGQRLFAASDLGSHDVWDLRPLDQDRCELLREIGARVPYEWDSGRAVLRTTPPVCHPIE